MNESQQITQSLTIVLTWRRQLARLKRTDAFKKEWHVGGKIWEFHFSSHAILAHPPTTSVEHSEPWMERWAARRLPLTHPPTVRKFLGVLMLGGREAATLCFYGKPFKEGNTKLCSVLYSTARVGGDEQHSPNKRSSFHGRPQGTRGTTEVLWETDFQLTRWKQWLSPQETRSVSVMEIRPFSSAVFQFLGSFHKRMPWWMQSGSVLAGWLHNDVKHPIHLRFYVCCLLHGNGWFLIHAICSRCVLNPTNGWIPNSEMKICH